MVILHLLQQMDELEWQMLDDTIQYLDSSIRRLRSGSSWIKNRELADQLEATINKRIDRIGA